MMVLTMMMSLFKMMVKTLWNRKVMMWHGCETNTRRMPTFPCFGEEAVRVMKVARMAEPDSPVDELQDL